MIAFHNPEDQVAIDTQPMAEQLAAAHAEFTNQKITEALIAKFGELPPPDEIAKHCICAVDQDNVSHYAWVEAKPQVGEKVDLSNVLCSIAPPKIHNPEKQ